MSKEGIYRDYRFNNETELNVEDDYFLWEETKKKAKNSVNATVNLLAEATHFDLPSTKYLEGKFRTCFTNTPKLTPYSYLLLYFQSILKWKTHHVEKIKFVKGTFSLEILKDAKEKKKLFLIQGKEKHSFINWDVKEQQKKMTVATKTYSIDDTLNHLKMISKLKRRG